MKQFVVIAVLACLALSAVATTEVKQVNAEQVKQLELRRLGVPKQVKDALKKIVVPLVIGILECLFDYVTEKLKGKLSKIPIFKPLSGIKRENIYTILIAVTISIWVNH